MISDFLYPQKCFIVLYYYLYTHNNYNSKLNNYYIIFYLYISTSGYSEHREVFMVALQYSYCLVVFIIPVLMLFMSVSLWHSWYLHSWFLLWWVICWVTVLIFLYDTAWWCGAGTGLYHLFNGSSSTFVFCLLVLCDKCIKNQVFGDGVII